MPDKPALQNLMSSVSPACPLCVAPQGVLIHEHAKFRVIRATGDAQAHYPAFYRLVWRAHVRELSDLSADELSLCMIAVVLMERSLREQLSPPPHKINVAALGNMVPHLHWHVIARYEWDAHWPAPVWASAAREADAATLQALIAQLPELDRRMQERLLELSEN